MSTALVNVRETYKNLGLALDKQKPELGKLLHGSATSPDRLVRIAMNAIARTPDLLNCEPKSIVRCVHQSAELHLELSGVMGEAYMIPFRNKGVLEAQFVPGYKGLIKLAEESPLITQVNAEIVHADDTFEEIKGSEPRLVHKPKHSGEVVFAYAIAFRTDGPPQWVTMTRATLEGFKKEALSKIKDGWKINKSPWTTSTEEMFRKCPVRRLCKYIPRTERLEKALSEDDRDWLPVADAREPNARTDALKSKLAGVEVKPVPDPVALDEDMLVAELVEEGEANAATDK